MSEAYFITGTDTGVGKTLVACALLHAAREAGLRTLGVKPVASGSERLGGVLRNADALAMQAAMSLSLPYEVVNPVALEPAVAPHLAAAQAGVALDVAGLGRACRHALGYAHDFAVIEGAGGWRVPLNGHETLADLARELAVPVVLVVGLRLGCINHAVLSAEAIHHDGLHLAGWVATELEPGMPCLEDNLATLAHWIDAPRVGWIAHRAGIEPRDAVHSLDLAALRCR